tara:strand:+ start:824 stop:1009 length:186 start_codon:yes stop_codon:yes gene_type:complete
MINSTEKFIPSSLSSRKLKALINDADHHGLQEEELEAAVAELAKRRNHLENYLPKSDRNSN